MTTNALITITLIAHSLIASAQEELEHIVVEGETPAYLANVSSAIPHQKILNGTRQSSDGLATLFEQSPAVNLIGQGGLFQTISIRGFARWRVQTLVEGVPIYTERRAGTSAEFVPPSLVGQAYLTAGAASTQLGSGALGGGIDLRLRLPESTSFETSYGSNQDYREFAAQGEINSKATDDNFYWLVNYRQANNSSAGNGSEIQDRFTQQSAALRHQNSKGWWKETLLFISQADDIAKASADRITERFTLYPRNDHILAKTTFDWHNTSFYFHDSRLDTVVTRPDNRVNLVQNTAVDFGLQLNDSFNTEDWGFFWRASIDARTGVKAEETETDINTQTAFNSTTLNAEQWEASAAIEFKRPLLGGTFIGGTRVAQLLQQNLSNTRGKTAVSDFNVSAFTGYAYPLTKHWHLSAYLSSAYRAPTLTERFFNGNTPRGTTQGDPNLATETAFNAELNLNYSNDYLNATIRVFDQRVDNFIERVNITNELRRFRNISSASVRGTSYEGSYRVDWQSIVWNLSLGGQWLQGVDEFNEPIADIAPAQHRLAIQAKASSRRAFVELVHRQSTDELVAGEQPTTSATVINLGVEQTFSDRLSLNLYLNNLNDELYLSSRDELAPFARGRDLQLTLRYIL